VIRVMAAILAIWTAVLFVGGLMYACKRFILSERVDVSSHIHLCTLNVQINFLLSPAVS
jgi:hypothetical protein